MYATLNSAPCASCQVKPKKGKPLTDIASHSKCKTGCTTRICGYKKKDENVDQVVLAIIAKTLYSHRHKHIQMKLTWYIVQDLLEEYREDVYVDESDGYLDELRAEEVDKDEELQDLMDFVFGLETEDKD